VETPYRHDVCCVCLAVLRDADDLELYSFGDEPMKAVALAVPALYFQRDADRMSGAERGDRP